MLASVAAALLAGPAFPQNTTPASAPDEDAVELSPFEVRAEATDGYVASESMTGSRVAVKIIDLPYTVNVLTSEFFEDFALYELADNVTHIGGFTGLDIGGGFNLRGFGSTSQLRDGFYRLGRYGSSNVDRMEIIKGSNAAIYGRTSPGGMVNMISKQPKERNYLKFTYNFGDYDTQRATVEATGTLHDGAVGRTSFILTGSYYQRGFDIPFARNINDEYYLALKHVFPDKSSLFVSAEYFHQTRHAPNSGAPLVTDQRGTSDQADDRAVGWAKNLVESNAFGPNSELNRGNTGFTAVYEKRFSPVWSTRVAGNYYKARRWDYNQNTGFGAVTINPANGAAPTTTRGATPNKGLIFEDGGGIQADLLAHYWLGERTIENRTLVTFDFNDYYRYDPTWNYGPSSHPDIVAWTNDPGRVLTLDPVTLRPAETITYFPKFFEWGAETLSRLTKRRTTNFGGLVRHQSAFMDGRMLTYVGARYDRVTFRHRDFRTTIAGIPPGGLIRRTVNELKPNFGINYKLTPGFRAFVNYSESYFVNQTDNPDVIAEADYQSETADGWDYGFKGSLLEDRLNFTVSGFYANRHNVRVSEFLETAPGQFTEVQRRQGAQLVRGAELDINWRVNDEITTGLSYGHVHSLLTDAGSTSPLSSGRRVQNVSPHNGSVYLRYAPAGGALKGFSGNIGVTYVSDTPGENPSPGGDVYQNVAGQRVLVRSTEAWKLEVPAFTLWNVGLRYKFPTRGRIDQSLALNVNNLFDKDYLKVNKQLGERRAFYVTYSIGFAGSN